MFLFNCYIAFVNKANKSLFMFTIYVLLSLEGELGNANEILHRQSRFESSLISSFVFTFKLCFGFARSLNFAKNFDKLLIFCYCIQPSVDNERRTKGICEESKMRSHQDSFFPSPTNSRLLKLIYKIR